MAGVPRVIPDGRRSRPVCEDSSCPDCGGPMMFAFGHHFPSHDESGVRHWFVSSHHCRKTGRVWLHCNGFVRGEGYVECHARSSGSTISEAMEALL